jgi:hypothetical protein
MEAGSDFMAVRGLAWLRQNGAARRNAREVGKFRQNRSHARGRSGMTHGG